MLTLLWQSPWPLGGPTTYTVHLARMLGAACRIVKIGARTERTLRPLGGYGLHYQRLALEDLLAVDGPILMTIGDPEMDENVWIKLSKRKNFWCVFHDPGEFTQFTYWNHFNRRRVITVRASGQAHMPGTKFIPHPYVPTYRTQLARKALQAPRRVYKATSVTRIANKKFSHWIAEANQMVSHDERCHFFGKPSGLWYKHYFLKNWPDAENYVHGKGFERTLSASPAVCGKSIYSVDLSDFSKLPNGGDGGGTQYTMLEAMDGGALLVLNAAWCRYPGPARRLAAHIVTGPVGLAAVLRKREPLSLRTQRQREGWRFLDTYHGVSVKEQYRDFFNLGFI